MSRIHQFYIQLSLPVPRPLPLEAIKKLRQEQGTEEPSLEALHDNVLYQSTGSGHPVNFTMEF